MIQALVTAKFLGVGVQDDVVRARLPDAHLVVGKALVDVEIEDEDAAGSLEDQDLVGFVFPRNVTGIRRQPSVLGFGPWKKRRKKPATWKWCLQIHRRIEVVQKLVSQGGVVHQVPLTSRVVIRTVVALARKVQPLGMPEFVAHERQVAFAAQTVRHQPDHLVQRHPAVDHVVGRALGRHARVHLFVHQPKGQRLVAHQGLIVRFRVSNTLFLPTSVAQRVNHVGHIPVFVLTQKRVFYRPPRTQICVWGKHYLSVQVTTDFGTVFREESIGEGFKNRNRFWEKSSFSKKKVYFWPQFLTVVFPSGSSGASGASGFRRVRLVRRVRLQARQACQAVEVQFNLLFFLFISPPNPSKIAGFWSKLHIFIVLDWTWPVFVPIAGFWP